MNHQRSIMNLQCIKWRKKMNLNPLAKMTPHPSKKKMSVRN